MGRPAAGAPQYHGRWRPLLRWRSHRCHLACLYRASDHAMPRFVDTFASCHGNGRAKKQDSKEGEQGSSRRRGRSVGGRSSRERRRGRLGPEGSNGQVGRLRCRQCVNLRSVRRRLVLSVAQSIAIRRKGRGQARTAGHHLALSLSLWTGSAGTSAASSLTASSWERPAFSRARINACFGSAAMSGATPLPSQSFPVLMS